MFRVARGVAVLGFALNQEAPPVITVTVEGSTLQELAAKLVVVLRNMYPEEPDFAAATGCEADVDPSILHGLLQEWAHAHGAEVDIRMRVAPTGRPRHLSVEEVERYYNKRPERSPV